MWNCTFRTVGRCYRGQRETEQEQPEDRMEGVGCWWKGEDDIVIMCTDAPTRWNCRYIGPIGCICQIWTLRWTLYYLGYFLVSVAVVEHINNSREPIQEMEAIYFISPSPSSVNKLISDFRSPKSSLYKKAHIYFTEGILTGNVSYYFCLWNSI